MPDQYNQIDVKIDKLRDKLSEAEWEDQDAIMIQMLSLETQILNDLTRNVNQISKDIRDMLGHLRTWGR